MPRTHTHIRIHRGDFLSSVDVFKNPLSDERLALGPRQVVLGVLVEHHHRPVLHFILAVVLQAANLHVQALGRLEVLGEVEARGPDGPHVGRQRAAVAREPLELLFAQAEAEGRREDAARLPPVVPDARHAVVDVGQ